MGSLIDSSVIVAADRGHLDWQKVVADLSSEPTAISAITAAELLQGVERADPKHRPRRPPQISHGRCASLHSPLCASSCVFFVLMASARH